VPRWLFRPEPRGHRSRPRATPATAPDVPRELQPPRGRDARGFKEELPALGNTLVLVLPLDRVGSGRGERMWGALPQGFPLPLVPGSQRGHPCAAFKNAPNRSMPIGVRYDAFRHMPWLWSAGGTDSARALPMLLPQGRAGELSGETVLRGVTRSLTSRFRSRRSGRYGRGVRAARSRRRAGVPRPGLIRPPLAMSPRARVGGRGSAPPG
jgi:hypothetical protein